MVTQKSPKTRQTFICEKCDYICYKQSDYNKHLTTRKHEKMTNDDKKLANLYTCDCGKRLSSRQSLYRHKKNCSNNVTIHTIDNTDNINNAPDHNMVIELLKQNQELMLSNKEFKELIVEQQEENLKLQNKLLEAVKDGKTINNTNCNNNNKFNLNFFLNEQCKNAMNISDFVNNMMLDIQDLQNTGKLGYVDGITKIFTEKLKALDKYNRPMHCTDLKRETLYIKQNNEWEKESVDKTKIKTAIECVANKNLNNLNAWKEENPNHVIMDSKEDKEFVEIMTNSLGGMGSDREKNKQKIIKNVLKEVMIEK
jgi:hypothetical protein